MSIEMEEFDEEMRGFFETTHYDEEGDWESNPETDEDPDDEGEADPNDIVFL
jgi:hypothetical protein